MIREPELIKKYKIHQRSFSYVQSLLQGDRRPGWGFTEYELTPEDHTVLACTVAHPFSFKLHGRMSIPPFFSYLIFCIFVYQEQDYIENILKRNLLLKTKDNIKWLLTFRTKFISLGLPSELKSMIKRVGPPNKEEEPYWENLKLIVNINDIFNNMSLINSYDDVLFDIDTKQLIELFLTTTYSSEKEMIDVFNRYTGVKWSTNEISNYVKLFYNLEYVEGEDWELYLQKIDPKEKLAKSSVKDTALDKVLLEKGLIWSDKITAILQDAIENYTAVYQENKRSPTSESIKASKDALDIVLKAKEKLDSINGGTTAIHDAIIAFKTKKEDYVRQHMIEQKDIKEIVKNIRK
jgi:hypothetical protein